ncbi:hypothetical protein [Streptomyces decoyicus]
MPADDMRIGDPAQLRKAGTGATEIAGETNTAGKHSADETKDASTAFRSTNWDGGLGGALTNLAEVWSSQTAALVGKCRSLGAQCTDTADNYTSVETQNKAAIANVAKGSNSSSPFG